MSLNKLKVFAKPEYFVIRYYYLMLINLSVLHVHRFYTLVPHNFGTENPPLLNSVEIIKNKTEMLDNLLEIEIAYSLLKTGRYLCLLGISNIT